MRRAQGRAGFTLLEVLVATLIMAIAIVGLLSNLTTSMRNAARLTEYDRAAMLAKRKMDELLVGPPMPKMVPIEGRYPVELAGVESGWRARASVFDMIPGAGPGATVLERIEVVVWWKQGEQTKTYRVDGYRRSILMPQDMGSMVPPAMLPPMEMQR